MSAIDLGPITNTLGDPRLASFHGSFVTYDPYAGRVSHSIVPKVENKPELEGAIPEPALPAELRENFLCEIPEDRRPPLTHPHDVCLQLDNMPWAVSRRRKCVTNTLGPR